MDHRSDKQIHASPGLISRGLGWVGKRLIRAAIPVDQLEPGHPLRRIIGIDDSGIGANINPTSAMQLAAVYRAIDLISSGVAVLPCEVFEQEEDGNKVPQITHPAYRLLHRRPNPNISPFHFKKLMTAWAAGWGNGIAEIQVNGLNEPVALWPIHPSRIADFPRDLRVKPTWMIHNNDGTQTPIPHDRLLRIMLYTMNGISGTSVVAHARSSFGGAIASDRFAAKFFTNDARPSIILRHPGHLSPDGAERLRQGWVRAYGGERSRGVAVLEDGMEAMPFGISNEDAQFLETRVFNVQEISRWFGVTPHKLFELSHGTFSNVEHLSIEHVTDCLHPWLTAWEEECDLKLIANNEDGNLFTRFDPTELLRGDNASRADYYSKMFGIGVYSVNEIRSKENENSIGPEGDKHVVPVNMTTLEKLGQTPPVPTASNAPPKKEPDIPPSDARDGKKPPKMVADEIRKLLRIARTAAIRKAKAGALTDEWRIHYEATKWQPLWQSMIGADCVMPAFSPELVKILSDSWVGDDAHIEACVAQFMNRG